ncbi:unknown [Bacteroides sp. CAG:927]|nr:unknown [Bacteroides sp. CAG:927]
MRILLQNHCCVQERSILQGRSGRWHAACSLLLMYAQAYPVLRSLDATLLHGSLPFADAMPPPLAFLPLPVSSPLILSFSWQPLCSDGMLHRNDRLWSAARQAGLWHCCVWHHQYWRNCISLSLVLERQWLVPSVCQVTAGWQAAPVAWHIADSSLPIFGR